MNKIYFQNINESLEHLEIFFADITRIWEERKGPEGIEKILAKKIDLVKDGTIKGHILFDNNQPVALAWVEFMSPYYGNMLLHCIDEEYIPAITNKIIESSLINNAILEVIQFTDTDQYHQLFRAADLFENIRQRMAIYIDETFSFPDEKPFIFFEEAGSEHVDISSKISFDAHKVSKDYEHYVELSELDKRQALEKRLYTGSYGKVIRPATLLMYYEDTPIGACSVVSTSCWGMEDVPWVFDLSLDPKYHGQGLGKHLMQQVLAILANAGYTITGLAVTTSNKSAIGLYEKLGFFKVDEFSEFTRVIS